MRLTFASRMRSRLVQLSVLWTSLCAASEHRRLVLVSPSPSFSRASAVALTAWDIEVATADVAAPGSSMPTAASRAKEMARETRGDAVVWISEDEGHHAAIWFFERESEQLVTRAIDGWPDSETSAAAVALTLKTLLRASKIAPLRERLGSEATQPMGAAGLFRLEAFALARTTTDQSLQPNFGIGGSWWPRFGDDVFGIALSGSVGLGTPIELSAFRGRFTDLSFAPALRFRIRLHRNWILSPTAAAGFHFTSLNGTTTAAGAVVQLSRTDVSLDTGLMVFFAPSTRFEIGARAAIGAMIQRQRFLAAGQPLFELPMVPIEFGLTTTVRLN